MTGVDNNLITDDRVISSSSYNQTDHIPSLKHIQRPQTTNVGTMVMKDTYESDNGIDLLT